MRLPLAILFFLPLAEIAAFVVVGKYIGVLATLGLTVLTGVVGLSLLRVQGAGILRRLQSESRNGADPGREIVHGAMIVIAAFLLIIPGFLTDIVGILLFLPFIRDFAWKLVKPHVAVVRESRFSYQASSSTSNDQSPSESTTIDLDENDFHRGPNRQSPWSLDKGRKD
ncbi:MULTISPECIES: FxsA family protein [Alphaproteobacteria]|uniref:Membrane protein FxsA n=2 Tax=Alphaproteobacteria TaxID=28211 RepID=A0A512HMB6_9HYPH|nr:MULTISPECIES: FxsA family protein [Alphaproteobacteria]GEO86588.1 membrane protein FxsA [Ciceribacter naphthalenivorans]GLR20840.1 membrane protein FxsA [Ciceribacter naphthalenivorans]GLT03696.1 membrane protein FxsA [Sphingomonas psychrolutea]